MTDLDFVPAVRSDYLRRDVEGETIVWSAVAGEPTVLDPVAALMLDVIDGEASMGQLATEVHEEVGVPLDVAQGQVERTIDLFRWAGLLTVPARVPSALEAIASRELFVNPPSA